MNYLYGDSTPSKLTSNVLEFLRDAIDFSVFAVQADERIKEGKARAREAEEEAQAELRRLEGFIAVVQRSIAEANKGRADSPTAHCGTRLVELVAGAERSAADGIRKALADRIATLDAQEAAVRASVLSALGRLLAPHDPPEASVALHATLSPSGRYEAQVTGKAPFGLSWTFDLAIADDDLFGTPLRIERVMPQLEIKAPQLSGWISKEVKIRPVRLERYVVTELVNEGTITRVKLRPEIGADNGFDLTADFRGSKRVSAKRVAPDGDASAGDFDVVDTSDVKNLLDLVEKLRNAAASIDRGELSTAVFDDEDFVAQPSFVPFVERLVAHLAPIVREIAARSTATELVLRRALGEDRREEIFVTKSTLRDKYAVLEPHHRALFAPLGLDSTVRPRQDTHSYIDEKPAIRAEVAPSVPPPPPKTPTSPAFPPKPPPPVPKAPSSTQQEAAAPRRDESSPNVVLELLAKNETLVTSVKKILTLSKNGRADEAYREYAELFASAEFAGYPPEEQRIVLKLMVLGKPVAARNDLITEASRAALDRIKGLVETHKDPADYELLGAAHLQLQEAAAARAAFETGLGLERMRDPQSPLSEALARRLTQLSQA